MMNRYQLSLFASFLLLLGACASEPSEQQENSTDTAALSTADVRLECRLTNDPETDPLGPTNEVFLILADNRVKVADVKTCEVITPDYYEQYQIPKNALMAVGGWYAGAGDYIYLIEEDGHFVVKQGEMYEEKEDNNYDYRTVFKFSKDGQQVL